MLCSSVAAMKKPHPKVRLEGSGEQAQGMRLVSRGLLTISSTIGMRSMS
jgi:hypothetical protein